MVDWNNREEVIKHLQHIKTTYIDLDKPTQIIKGDYRLEVYYLGSLIYFIDTKPLDIKLDDFLKEELKKGNE